MINFDFNFLNKALEVLALPEEEKKDLLTKYNNLLVVKMIELSGLTEEEKNFFQDNKNPLELFSKLGESAKKNQEFLKGIEDYIHNLNLEFIETFSKSATEEQKKTLVNYFDEYEQQLQNLPQQYTV